MNVLKIGDKVTIQNSNLEGLIVYTINPNDKFSKGKEFMVHFNNNRSYDPDRGIFAETELIKVKPKIVLKEILKGEEVCAPV